ncbi:MAG: 50S ribosomal protein L17 [Candidatus Omnitrophota bacterium]
MRHQRHRTSLGIKSGHRRALVNNTAINLIKHNRITTTLKRAKVVSQFVDKLVTLAKRKDLHAQRQLFSSLKSRELVQRMINDVAPRFAKRNGGYTRVLRYKNRAGDGAITAILEFTEISEVKEKGKGKKKKVKKEIKGASVADEEKMEKRASVDSQDQKEEKKEEKIKEKAKEKEKKDIGSNGGDEETPPDKEKKGNFFTNLRGYLKK